jgi:hypothetical protein
MGDQGAFAANELRSFNAEKVRKKVERLMPWANPNPYFHENTS